ncbi:hypothetical protein AJ79_01402 [Helicocarpus griseus UAMH5409]|uniref:Uncharacterized protein n=1 Tax=Helicocarpus griseus UAMH5409 TaxID=1447875 RepID=A0A2B7Y7W6_9EURO|nr:hypothetical protein AJ79_01402 [Helicocarpus griseus UAMH5409]
MTRVTRAASRRNNIHDIENPTETTPHASPIEASNNASVFCSTRNTLGEITGNRDYVQTSSISPEPKRAADGVSPEKTTENATGPQIKRSRSIRDLINPEDLGIKVFGKARLTGAGGDDLQTPHTQASDPVLDSRREQKGG